MRIQAEIDTTGLIYGLNTQIQESLNIAIGPGMKYLRAKLLDKLKTTHYSLAELRSLGHPYARRRLVAFSCGRKLPTLRNKLERHLKTSTVRIRAYGRIAGKVRTDIINKQSGTLMRSLDIHYRKSYLSKTSKPTVKSLKGYKIEASLIIPSSKVRYAYYVFMGTSRLIPRPIHYLVAKKEQYNVAKVMEKEMQKYFDASYSTGPIKVFD